MTLPVTVEAVGCAWQ